MATDYHMPILFQFISWVLESLDNWYYKHFGYKRTRFGQKLLWIEERERFRAKMVSLGYHFPDEGFTI